MLSLGINGERELRRQQANPGSPGKMAVRTVCVCDSLVSRITRMSAMPKTLAVCYAGIDLLTNCYHQTVCFISVNINSAAVTVFTVNV